MSELLTINLTGQDIGKSTVSITVPFAWTKYFPDEPGWYWAKRKGHDPEIVHIIIENGKSYRVADDEGLRTSLEFLHIDLWYGPLPMLELPKEGE